MSVKPAKNPIPKKLRARFKEALAILGISIEEREVVFVDDVGDEYCAFAVLYVKEKGP